MSNTVDSQLSDIREITKYNQLLTYYEQNKDNNWDEWLEFIEVFKRSGKQGVVGLMKIKNTDIKCIFKLSQYINYLTQHEFSVMKGLDDIYTYCPHFCRSIGLTIGKVEPRYKKNDENPFNIKSRYPIEKEILLCEYIETDKKLYNYIRDKNISFDIMFSIIKQVIMGINIAQRKKQFTHYDLHSYNIMMKECDKDIVFLYVLDDENQYCVPTMGHYPVIIDFGFSYANDLKNQPLWQSMSFTDTGFISDRFDWVADPKLFLVTVSDEMVTNRPSKLTKKFRRVVKNIFSSLNIDFESGWDNVDNKGASDYVIEMLEEYNKDSELFTKYDHYCIDLLTSLIIQPLEEQNYVNIDVSYMTFMKEWIKIEQQLTNPFYCLNTLKNIIDSARDIRPEYMSSDNGMKEKALHYFKRTINDSISKISKFCRLKDIHYEKLLCSLLVLSKNIEGVLYDIMENRIHEKKKEYDKLPIQNIDQIYGAVETNLPDKYIFNENTVVYVLNCVSQNCVKFIPDKSLLNKINELHPIERGIFLYEKFTEK
jgi:hypothetical protein